MDLKQQILHYYRVEERSLREIARLTKTDRKTVSHFDREGTEMLFNHLSLRSGTKATIITTNLPFTRWEEIMKDKVLCSALVDRLCHKAYLVNMTGQSYRVRETQKNEKIVIVTGLVYLCLYLFKWSFFSSTIRGKSTVLSTV